MALQRDTFTRRIKFNGTLSRAQLDSIVADVEIENLQPNGPVTDAVWKQVDKHVFARRPELTLICGGFSTELHFIRLLPNLRRLQVGCDGLDFLAAATDDLSELYLQLIEGYTPSLLTISRLAKLQSLTIEGKASGFEAIGDLVQLEALVLGKGKLQRLDFLTSLPKLKRLWIRSSTVADMSSLAKLNQLEDLTLMSMLGLKDVSFLAKMKGLRHLQLWELPRVYDLPDLSKLRRLEDLRIMQLPRIDRRKLLLPPLKYLEDRYRHNMKPQEYIDLMERFAIDRAWIRFNSERYSQKFEQMQEELHKRRAAKLAAGT